MCLEFIYKRVKKYKKSNALYRNVFDFFVYIFSMLNLGHLQVNFLRNLRMEEKND